MRGHRGFMLSVLAIISTAAGCGSIEGRWVVERIAPPEATCHFYPKRVVFCEDQSFVLIHKVDEVFVRETGTYCYSAGRGELVLTTNGQEKLYDVSITGDKLRLRGELPDGQCVEARMIRAKRSSPFETRDPVNEPKPLNRPKRDAVQNTAIPLSLAKEPAPAEGESVAEPMPAPIVEPAPAVEPPPVIEPAPVEVAPPPADEPVSNEPAADAQPAPAVEPAPADEPAADSASPSEEPAAPAEPAPPADAPVEPAPPVVEPPADAPAEPTEEPATDEPEAEPSEPATPPVDQSSDSGS